MNVMTIVWFGVIAVGCAIIGPLIMVLFQRIATAETTRRFEASAAAIAEQAAAHRIETLAALTQIHTLVNSNLTLALHRELDASRAMLAAQREVIALKEDRGIVISPATLDAVERAEARVGELALDLVRKQEQTIIADAQALEP